MPVTPRGTSWQAAVSHKGKRYRKDFATKQEAIIWEAQTKADLLAGRFDVTPDKGKDEGKKTLSDLLDYVSRSRWRGTKAEKVANLNANDVVKILGPTRLVSSLSKADALKVKDAMIKRCRSDATINRKLSTLSVMVKAAVELDWLDKGFTVGLLKERGNRVRYFTEKEEQDMIDWCALWGFRDLLDYIIVSIDTGFRQGEVLKIEKRDVGRSNLWTYDTKSGKNREVPLTARAMTVLYRRAGKLEDPEAKVFKLKASALRDDWKKMQAALEMQDDEEYTPHVLRHTFVTRLLERGVDIKTVQELAGHERIETTQKYAHTSPERKRAAIEKLVMTHDTCGISGVTQAQV